VTDEAGASVKVERVTIGQVVMGGDGQVRTVKVSRRRATAAAAATTAMAEAAAAPCGPARG
jgi:hypothetical protein